MKRFHIYRRFRILILAVILGIVILLQPHNHSHDTHQEDQTMVDMYRIPVGTFECIVINDGDTEYATSDFLFYNAPEDDLKIQMIRYGLNPDHIRCANNCLLIQTGDALVLIDTGCGPEAPNTPGLEHTGKLTRGLKAHDINPENVDWVFLTHYHADHVWGIIDEKGQPAFPNARFVMFQTEYSAGLDDELSGEKLNSIKGKMQLLGKNTEILPGITAIRAPGHTPGHMIVSVVSGKEELLITGDMFAHPIHASHPDWTMSHETDKTAAVENRKDILRKAAEENILVHAYHISFPGLGHIIKDDHGWEWKPVE